MRVRLVAAFVGCLVLAAACSPTDDAGPTGVTTEVSEAQAGDESSAAADGDFVEADAPPSDELIAENAIVVGAIIDRTGLMKALDEPALEAARVQIARINERGGVLGRPLVLSEFDSRSLLNASYQAANELIGDGAEIFLVTCDFEFARPAIEVATDASRLVLSPCGGTAEWGDPAVAGRNVFSFAMPSAAEGVLMADYVLDVYGTTVTLIVDSTDPDALAQCDAFEQTYRAGGGGFRGRLEVDLESAPDLKANVASLVRTSFDLPSAVIVCASPTVGQDIVLFLRRSGLEAPIVAGSTMDGDDWIVNVERTGEMIVLSYGSVFGDDPDQAVNELFDEYEVLTGVRPDQGRPVTGADAIEAFAIAAERAGSLDLDALIAELEGFDGQTLVAGTVSFSPTSHISARAMRLMRIEDRRPNFLEMIEVRPEEFVPQASPQPTPTISPDELEDPSAPAAGDGP